jgi:hypothetical protein
LLKFFGVSFPLYNCCLHFMLPFSHHWTCKFSMQNHQSC